MWEQVSAASVLLLIYIPRTPATGLAVERLHAKPSLVGAYKAGFQVCLCASRVTDLVVSVCK